MSYKGRYKPVNPKKYRGDYSQVIYRSLWERKLMVYCDNNNAVLEWGSEEVIIPYRSPWDGRIDRYFPDFYMKVKQSNGTIKKFIIEVKPKYWYKDVENWGINSAKWKSATEYCKDQNMEFKILTEDHLNPQYK